MKARGGSRSFGIDQAINKYLTGPADAACWQAACRDPDKANRAMRRAIKSATRKAQKKRSKA